MHDGRGPVAVLTGAASGIGRATAELLVERGHRVVGLDLDLDGFGWAAGEEAIVPLAGDVTTPEANEALVRTALDRFGRLDVAVLNAGVAGNPALEDDGALERFDQVVAVNLRGVVLGLRAALPAIRASGGGAVVATSSVSGLRGDPGMWAYSASKAGVVNLVRAVALDYAARGVRVNAVCPGPVRTGITARLERNAAAFEGLRRSLPLQRWGEPREVAEVIAFLASPAASFVTGVAVPVDGGVSASTAMFLPPQAPAPG